jgi:hypothetical protein
MSQHFRFDPSSSLMVARQTAVGGCRLSGGFMASCGRLSKVDCKLAPDVPSGLLSPFKSAGRITPGAYGGRVATKGLELCDGSMLLFACLRWREQEHDPRRATAP